MSNTMHPDVKLAFQEIDAALFSGDQFYDVENLKTLLNYIDRWNTQINDIIDVMDIPR